MQFSVTTPSGERIWRPGILTREEMRYVIRNTDSRFVRAVVARELFPSIKRKSRTPHETNQ